MIQFLRRTADSLYWEWCQAGRCPQTLSCTAVFGIKHRCPDNCRCVCFKPWLTSGPQRDVKWQGFFFFFIWFTVPLSFSLSLSLSHTHWNRSREGRWHVDQWNDCRSGGGWRQRSCEVTHVSASPALSAAPMCLFPWRYRPAIKDSWGARWSDPLTQLMFGYATLVVLVDRAKREKQLRNLCECAKITSEN